MITIGYKQSHSDHTLFIKHSASRRAIALIVYVDDVIVTRNDLEEREALKWCLAKEFEIKELGKLKYFLEIEVAHSKNGIFVSQQKYVLVLLQETRKIKCKSIDTPIDLNHKLKEENENVTVDKGIYQRLVGRMIYLSHTRSDIAYVVNLMSQFLHNLKEIHLQVVYRILHYP